MDSETSGVIFTFSPFSLNGEEHRNLTHLGAVDQEHLSSRLAAGGFDTFHGSVLGDQHLSPEDLSGVNSLSEALVPYSSGLDKVAVNVVAHGSPDKIGLKNGKQLIGPKKLAKSFYSCILDSFKEKKIELPQGGVSFYIRACDSAFPIRKIVEESDFNIKTLERLFKKKYVKKYFIELLLEYKGLLGLDANLDRSMRKFHDMLQKPRCFKNDITGLLKRYSGKDGDEFNKAFRKEAEGIYASNECKLQGLCAEKLFKGFLKEYEATIAGDEVKSSIKGFRSKVAKIYKKNCKKLFRSSFAGQFANYLKDAMSGKDGSDQFRFAVSGFAGLMKAPKGPASPRMRNRLDVPVTLTDSRYTASWDLERMLYDYPSHRAIIYSILSPDFKDASSDDCALSWRQYYTTSLSEEVVDSVIFDAKFVKGKPAPPVSDHISDEEMLSSAFGRGSNLAQSITSMR
jgi:hypothetical protein